MIWGGGERIARKMMHHSPTMEKGSGPYFLAASGLVGTSAMARQKNGTRPLFRGWVGLDGWGDGRGSRRGEAGADIVVEGGEGRWVGHAGMGMRTAQGHGTQVGQATRRPVWPTMIRQTWLDF